MSPVVRDKVRISRRRVLISSSGFQADPAFDAVPFQELKDLQARPKTGWWKRLWA